MPFLVFLLSIACGHGAPPAPPVSATVRPAPVVPVAETDPRFEPLRGLFGAWRGEDPDRHSTGGFTLEPDLGGKVLVRRGWNDGPEGHHEDLMVVFASPAGLRAVYFDNEGHSIDYAVNASAERVEFLSDVVPNQPRFRLRYDLQDADTLAIDFAIAMPGATEFQHYTGGTVHRGSP